MGEKRKAIAVYGGALYEEKEYGLLKALVDACGDKYIVCAYSFTIDDMNNEKMSDEEEELIEISRGIDYAGIVLMVVAMRNNRRFCDEILEIAESRHIPVFAFEQSYPGCIDLSFAHKEGFRDIVRHVVADHGARRVNMIAGMKDNIYSKERIEAYREVLSENGIEFEEKRLGYGDFWDRPARAVTESFLAQDELPDAIVCANDTMAVSAIAVLQEKGYRVPEDVIVTGFDGINTGKLHSPSITTVSTNYAECVAYILERIEQGGEGCEGEAHPVRGIQERMCSCGCLKDDDKLSRELMAEYADSFMDVNWCLRLMNQLASKAAILEDLGMLSRELLAALWVWMKQYHFVGIYSELLAEEFKEPSRKRFNTFLRYYNETEREVMGKEFASSEVIPGIDGLLSKDSPFRFIMFRLLATQDTSYGFLAQGMSAINNRDVRRCDEIGMFLSTALNTVLNNRRLGMLNRHLRAANLEIEKSAVSDYLTGIYNRRGFFSRLAEELSSEHNAGRILTVFSIDMDGLKGINDNYGHNEGDEAICGMAEAIKHFCRRNGFCARYGGDEFACALITDNELSLDADTVRERFDEAIKHDQNLTDKPYEIAASVGSASAGIIRNMDVEELIRRADSAMYLDKQLRKKNRR